MKYILMMNTMKSTAAPFPGWSEQDIKTHIGFMIQINKDLRASGELVTAEGLVVSRPGQTRSGQGRTARPSPTASSPRAKSSSPATGSSTSTRPERAYAIAAQVSAAPGAAGAPLNMPIEVRSIMSGPPPEFL